VAPVTNTFMGISFVIQLHAVTSEDAIDLLPVTCMRSITHPRSHAPDLRAIPGNRTDRELEGPPQTLPTRPMGLLAS
jgi:hypothetical protein